ncbi:TlpA disulfide reductase family protein [Polyangium spumosum]|nr:TlpA disulfide reductase family protein [Polyangium spumosum]
MQSADSRDKSRAGRSSSRVRAAAVRGILGIGVVLGMTMAPAPQASAEHRPSRRAWIGVELAPGPAGGGVLAKHVVTSSPARSGGLVDGDVILAVDGVALVKPEQLVARVAIAGPGGSMKLTIRRGAAEREHVVVPVAFPGAEEVLRLDKVGTFAPTWKALERVAGSVPDNIGKLRGRVVVVDFWASWCGPCRAISKDLSKLHAAYGDKGLSIVGLTGEPKAVAEKAATELGMRYPVASDPDDRTAALYGIRSLPTMFVVDKKGVIREVFVGYGPGRGATLEKIVADLIAEPSPSG